MGMLMSLATSDLWELPMVFEDFLEVPVVSRISNGSDYIV